MERSGESSWNDKIFILVAGSAVIIILLNPWIFFLSFLSFFLGYYLLDGISEKLKILLLKPSEDGEKAQAFSLDPLLHPTPFLIGDSNVEEDGTGSNNEKRGSTPVTCIVCDDDSCNRSEFSSDNNCHNKIDFGRRGSSSSRRDLCVDPELDQAIARFCTSVFDYYISTSWAPYETRKQLKLAFKKVLTNFGHQLECSLVQDDKGGAVSFCEEKVIPLCIHYLEKISERRNNRRSSSDGRDCDLEKLANLKVRRLCRQLLESNLPSEYQQCKLWMELCLAVLADGVLWNLIILGRNRLPGLFVQLVANFKRISDSVSPVPDVISIIYSKASSVCFRPQQQVDFGVVSSSEPASSRKVSKSQVPLLLGSFLDPVNDLYQPDMIFSRWRPTLDEILVERDLLYCLIQYLKGQQALEYLQAVLDETPDGNLYCRKVLQLEYLPGFCRSRYFMETLGISQVDCALEAGNDSPGTRRKIGHSRSSSYGGGNSGIQIWKIGDPKAVDGLPLHNTNQSVQSLGSSPEIDTTTYRRRQFSIEELIYKFLQSTANPRVEVDSIEKPKRVGIHGKSYEDDAADQVASKLVLGNCDIFECASQLAISWLDRHPWIQPVVSGWSQLLRPYMKPHLDTLIKSQLEQNLSLHNCVFLINLVTDAFLSLITDTPEEEEDTVKDRKDLNSKKDVPATQLSSLSSLCCWFLNLLIDPDSFAQAVKDNEDEIILFFVDLLDLLVNQVCGGGREK